MRKPVLLIVGLIVGIISCNKDKGNVNNGPSREELIVGLWKSELIETYTIKDADGDTVNMLILPGGNIKLDVRADKSLTAIILGDTTQGTYSLNGNMITIMEQDTFSGNITSLSETRLVLDGEKRLTDTSGTYTEYRHLEFVK